MNSVLKYIESGIRVFDGAMGSMLMKLGHSSNECPETADKNIVMKIHKAYLDAGADFIITNTFGGNRIKLDKWGKGQDTVSINKSAVENCKNLSEKEYYIAGDIGPSGEFVEPYGNMKYEEMVNIFAEQAQALSEAGVDILLIETMTSLDELKAAIEGCQRVSKLPIIGCMTFNKDSKGFHTMMGHNVESFVNLIEEKKVEVIGTNCTLDPIVITDLVMEIRKLTKKPLLAQPNAGAPQLVNGETVYSKIDNLETYIRKIIENGANLVGGCCGTEPDYVKTVANIVKEYNK